MLTPKKTTPIDLSEIGNYPDFQKLHEKWSSAIDAGEDGALDLFDVPLPLAPTVMLIELEPDYSDGAVRLAGTYVCQVHGGEMRGKKVSSFFSDTDAREVLDSMRHCIETGAVDLSLREYVSMEQEHWSYVRILVPQPDKNGKKRILKAMDRSTLRRIPWSS